METPDPPNDTFGVLKQVVLTPHDIPWSLRVLQLKPSNGGRFEAQLIVDCLLGARWFGIRRRGTPKYTNPFHKGIQGIQTFNPNQQLTISWLKPCQKTKQNAIVVLHAKKHFIFESCVVFFQESINYIKLVNSCNLSLLLVMILRLRKGSK